MILTGMDQPRDPLEQLTPQQRREAAQKFVRMLRQEPRSETAWWGLAACVESAAQKRDCLLNILKINPWNEEARLELEKLAQVRPDPLALAQEAESCRDFETALECYTHVIETAPDNPLVCASAWIGKGFAAGMLTTPRENRLREFFACLQQGLQAGVPAGSPVNTPSGFSMKKAAAALPPALLARLARCLMELTDYTTSLAGRCPPDLMNLYEIERVHLADWTCYAAGLANLPANQTYSHDGLVFIAVDAYARIAANIIHNTRGPHARRELLHTYKLFLLSNLSLSGLNKDLALLNRLEAIQER